MTDFGNALISVVFLLLIAPPTVDWTMGTIMIILTWEAAARNNDVVLQPSQYLRFSMQELFAIHLFYPESSLFFLLSVFHNFLIVV